MSVHTTVEHSLDFIFCIQSQWAASTLIIEENREAITHIYILGRNLFFITYQTMLPIPISEVVVSKAIIDKVEKRFVRRSIMKGEKDYSNRKHRGRMFYSTRTTPGRTCEIAV